MASKTVETYRRYLADIDAAVAADDLWRASYLAQNAVYFSSNAGEASALANRLTATMVSRHDDVDEIVRGLRALAPGQ